MDSLKGKLIAVEGVDGAGKTTFCEELCRAVAAHGEHPVYFKFPSRESGIGNLIMNAMERHPEMTEGLASLFVAERAIMSQYKMAQFLGDGRSTIVIADRYIDSGTIYGCWFDERIKAWVSTPEWARTRRPDYSILLDIPPGEAVKRCRERGRAVSKWDTDEWGTHLKRERFLNLFKGRPNSIILDGTLSTKTLVDQFLEWDVIVGVNS